MDCLDLLNLPISIFVSSISIEKSDFHEMVFVARVYIFLDSHLLHHNLICIISAITERGRNLHAEICSGFYANLMLLIELVL